MDEIDGSVIQVSVVQWKQMDYSSKLVPISYLKETDEGVMLIVSNDWPHYMDAIAMLYVYYFERCITFVRFAYGW